MKPRSSRMWQRSWCQLQASRKGEKVVSDPIEGRCLERLQFTCDLQQENGWAISPIVIWHGESQTKEKCSLTSLLSIEFIQEDPCSLYGWESQDPAGWSGVESRLVGQWWHMAQVTNSTMRVNAVSPRLAGAMCLINIGPGYLINMKRIGESCILWFIFIANLAFNFLDKLSQDSSCS